MSGAFATAFAAAYDVDEPIPPEQLEHASRVVLEHVLARLLDPATEGGADDAEQIRRELAARTWQNINPYADAPSG